MISAKVVGKADDLGELVKEINTASWDESNEMVEFEVEALAAYLDHQDTVFVVCHDRAEGRRTFLGMASARLELKPYGGERWLYVDEIDVCTDQRQKGAGTVMMRKLIEVATEAGCESMWLATETDNDAANALYRSLDPDDVAPIIGYTFEIAELNGGPPAG